MNLKQQIAGATLAFLLGGCSPQTQEQVKDTSAAVVQDVKENAKDAVQEGKEAASDVSVTTSVKSALLASDKMDTSQLNVDTVDGKVYLKGSVPTEEQKVLAENIAKNTLVAGTSLTNELTVEGATASPSPAMTSSPATTTTSTTTSPTPALSATPVGSKPAL